MHILSAETDNCPWVYFIRYVTCDMLSTQKQYAHYVLRFAIYRVLIVICKLFFYDLLYIECIYYELYIMNITSYELIFSVQVHYSHYLLRFAIYWVYKYTIHITYYNLQYIEYKYTTHIISYDFQYIEFINTLRIFLLMICKIFSVQIRYAHYVLWFACIEYINTLCTLLLMIFDILSV